MILFRRKIFIIVVIGVLATTGFLAKIFVKSKESTVLTFVITETGKFTSLDPLDGDGSQNLPVARMLYATPVEIFSDNTLGSRVLETFEYNKGNYSASRLT